MEVRSMCTGCGTGLSVAVGEPVPEHDGWKECDGGVAVAFDARWPPCPCHRLGRRVPDELGHLRSAAVVLVRKLDGAPGHVEEVLAGGGLAGWAFPCTWDAGAVVQTMRRLGVNVALDNGRVPPNWNHAALAGGGDPRVLARVVRELEKVGVVPRREAGLEAWG